MSVPNAVVSCAAARPSPTRTAARATVLRAPRGDDDARVRCPTACGTPTIAAVAAEMGIVMLSARVPVKRSPTCWVSRMYRAQQTAEPIAKPIPTPRSPRQGCVSSSTPINASAGHSGARLVWLRTAATESGPRNSMATEVPRGMLDGGQEHDRHEPGGHTQGGQGRKITGRDLTKWRRAIAMKIRAPAVSRSQAVPAAPTRRSVGATAPSRAGPSIMPTAIAHGGKTGAGSTGARHVVSRWLQMLVANPSAGG